MTPPGAPTAALAPRGATVTIAVRLGTTARGRRRLAPAPAATAAPAPPAGRVPRVARMVALAHRWQDLIRAGVARDQAGLARLVGVSRVRVTQVMDLLRLAPDVQEELLFLPRVERGRDPLRERDLWPIAALSLWSDQRRAWNEIRTRLENPHARDR